MYDKYPVTNESQPQSTHWVKICLFVAILVIVALIAFNFIENRNAEVAPVIYVSSPEPADDTVVEQLLMRIQRLEEELDTVSAAAAAVQEVTPEPPPTPTTEPTPSPEPTPPPGPTPTPLHVAAPMHDYRNVWLRESARMGGDAYRNALVYHSGNSLGGGRAFSLHNLRGQYTLLTGYMGRVDSSIYRYVNVRFYGDGYLIKYYHIIPGSLPIPISVPLEGVSLLRISVNGWNTHYALYGFLE
ncbi:MAG: hypothetical protein FWC92_08325 [Defluviitaleaceae bacterium]|nr:hypothetical protein [Defluviitaleaceae bacterium]